MGHTYANILIHAIFSTKNRRPLVTDLSARSRVHEYIGGVIRETGGSALGVGGPSDHIHALVVLPKTVALADLMRIIKANSSRWINETFRETEFAWQTGYGAFSVSQSSRDSVLAYIAKQNEHHRTVSFQEEFVAFLKRHEIEYDERYIWE